MTVIIDDREVGGTSRLTCSGGGRASPDGTLRRVPRSSNAKPHILVPAFTRDSAYEFVRLETLAVTLCYGARWRYLALLTRHGESRFCAEIHRTLDVPLSVVPANVRRARVVPGVDDPHA